MQKLQGENWMFTINNPTEDDVKQLEESHETLPMVYMVYQKEKGKEGTEHLQGYFELSKHKRANVIAKTIKRAHLELRKGSQVQAINYCKKADTQVEEPVIWGLPKETHSGRRTDIKAMVQDIALMPKMGFVEANPGLYSKYHRSIDMLYDKKISNTIRQPPNVHVLYGAPETGKTRYVYDNYPIDKIYKMAKSNGDRVWFNGYDPEIHEVLLLDDFYGWIPYGFLLQLLDRYPMRVETKGGFVNVLFKEIYITSNVPPEDWYDWGKGMDQRALQRRITDVKAMGVLLDDNSVEIMKHRKEEGYKPKPAAKLRCPRKDIDPKLNINFETI